MARDPILVRRKPPRGVVLLEHETFDVLDQVSPAGAGVEAGEVSSHVQGEALRRPDGKVPAYTSLIEAAQQARGKLTFCVENEDDTPLVEGYQTLFAAARCLRGELGDVSSAALHIIDRRTHLRAFWACVLSLCVPANVAVDPSSPDPFAKLRGAVEVLRCEVVVASREVAGRLEGIFRDDVRVVDVDAAMVRAERTTRRGLDATAGPGDAAYAQLTSGSTGRPKCILETHGAIIFHIRSSAQQAGHSPGDVSLNWLPLDHVVPIITCHCADVYLSRNAVQVPTHCILRDPVRWLRAMHQFRVSHSWAPNFGFQLVAEALGTQRCPSLTTVRRLMNAGEQVTLEACDAFCAATGLSSSVLQPAFGMAEVATCVAYNDMFGEKPSLRVATASFGAAVLRFSRDNEPSYDFVDLGGPAPGVELRIVGGNGVVLAEKCVGRLQIKGACCMQGYVGTDEALVDGWLDSGDLGFVYHGRLHITGRAKESICVRGQTLFCYDIEASTSRHCLGTSDGGRVAVVAARSRSSREECVVVFIKVEMWTVHVRVLHGVGRKRGELLRGPLEECLESVEKHVARTFGVAPRYVIPLDGSPDLELSRTTSGKIMRSKLAAQFCSGAYDTARAALDCARRGERVFPDFFAEPIWLDLAPLPGVNEGSLTLKKDSAEVGREARIVDIRTVSNEGALADECARVATALVSAARAEKNVDRLVCAVHSTGAAACAAALGRALVEEGTCESIRVLLGAPTSALEAEARDTEAYDVVAYVDGRRRALSLSRIDEERARALTNPRSGPLEDVVLTGGLGDLGLDLLRLLATQATRILVVGRRPRDAAFEALGVASDLDVSRVTYVSIDLASSGAAGAIVGAVRDWRASGSVTVVHLAGAPPTKLPVVDLDHEAISTALGAKVRGAEQLHVALVDDLGLRPSFVYFGSAVARAPGAGLGAYAAANAALEAFADWQRSRGLESRVVAWSTWGEVAIGMRRELVPLPRPTALSVARTLILSAGRFSTVYVGLDVDAHDSEHEVLFYASDSQIGAVPESAVPIWLPRWPLTGQNEVDLDVLRSAPFDSLRMQHSPTASTTTGIVLDVLREAVGRPVRASDSIAALGLDSIKAVSIVRGVRERLGRDLAPTALYDAVTVRDLAASLGDASAQFDATGLEKLLVDIRTARLELVSAASLPPARREPRRIVLVGAGGLATEVAAAMLESVEDVTAYDDDAARRDTELVPGVQVRGPVAAATAAAGDMIICVGQNETRRQIAATLGNPGRAWVSPRAMVCSHVELQPGTYVGPHAFVGPRVHIGSHCFVQPGAMIGHDCVLENFCFVGANACVGGGCVIGEGAVLGMGSVIAPGRSIGAWTTLAAGSAAVDNVPAHAACAGVPAVVTGRREKTRVA